MKLIALAAAAVACGGAQRPRPNDGAIVGVARDHDSGDPVAKATIVVRAEGVIGKSVSVTSDAKGAYDLEHLAPGRYTLSASFAGQPINVENITVARGKTAVVDLTFTLGRPDAVMVDFGNPKEGEIDRYHPSHHSPATGVIEGTVSDSGSRDRVPGAVVTAIPGNGQTLQAVTDDDGRYRFDDVLPGTYVVSAYYSIAGRGQIEIRRSDIAVAGGEGVIVPLWIESAKQ